MITSIEIQLIEYFLSCKGRNLIYEENVIQLPNTISYGYTLPNIFSFVQFQQNIFSYFGIGSSELAVSDEYSGCAFVKFGRGKSEYIGHLSLGNGSPWNKRMWEQFVQDARISNYKLFYPFKGFPEQIITDLTESYRYQTYKLNCVGLIDKNNICYSAIYDVEAKKIQYLQSWENVHNNEYESKQIDGQIFFNYF